MNQDCCPYCGRWLITYHADGSFDLAPKAGVTLEMRAPTSIAGVPLAGGFVRGEPVPKSAFCERIACRFRRWLDRDK